MADLTFRVHADPSFGTVTCYATTALDELPAYALEERLGRIAGVEVVRERRYSVELAVAEHVIGVHAVALRAAVRLRELQEWFAIWGYALGDVDVVPEAPKAGL